MSILYKVVLLDGNLYGAGHESRGWFCLDFKTGGKLWQSPGKGSLTYADGRLYVRHSEQLFAYDIQKD